MRLPKKLRLTILILLLTPLLALKTNISFASEQNQVETERAISIRFGDIKDALLHEKIENIKYHPSPNTPEIP